MTDGKYFYSVNDRGIIWCLDAKTGKEIWGSKRIKPAIYSSSPVLADGKIYITNEEGLTTVLKAGDQFEVLAENDLADYTLSSPAISDGRIFMRTTQYLVRHRQEVGAMRFALVLILGAWGAYSQDWPQFRGPNAAGVSDDTKLPVAFGPQKNVVWKTAATAGQFVAGGGRRPDHSDRGRERKTPHHRAGPGYRQDPVAARSPAASQTGDRAARQRPGLRQLRPRTAGMLTSSFRISDCWPTVPTETSCGACRWDRSTTPSATAPLRF